MSDRARLIVALGFDWCDHLARTSHIVKDAPARGRLPASERSISAGWGDQYNHATEGQELELTGRLPGIYYLVTTSNPDGNFLETDYSNNTVGPASVCGATDVSRACLPPSTGVQAGGRPGPEGPQQRVPGRSATGRAVPGVVFGFAAAGALVAITAFMRRSSRRLS